MLPGENIVDDALVDEPGVTHGGKDLVGEELCERLCGEGRQPMEVPGGIEDAV